MNLRDLGFMAGLYLRNGDWFSAEAFLRAMVDQLCMISGQTA